MLLAVHRVSSYGCTREVWRAREKLELLSVEPQATLTLLSCSPNFPRASRVSLMVAGRGSRVAGFKSRVTGFEKVAGF